MNKTILMGRLTADPVTQTTPSNKQVCRFTLAVDRRFAKEGQQQADFIACVAWEKTANFISTYFTKGAMIAVEGRIQTRSWDGNDGKKRYATEVVIDHAEFTGEKRERGNGSQDQPDNRAPKQIPEQNQTQYSQERMDLYGDGFVDLGEPNEDDLPF